MILEIKLSNFYSIKDEIILDMRAASIKSKNAKALSDNLFSHGDIDVLKTVIMYGANASGKSNVLKAIRFCCSLILNSHNHNENTSFYYQKFKFANCAGKPSQFFIRFVVDNIEYEYAYSIMQDRILTESLYYYPKGRLKKLFVRDETKGNTKKEKYDFGTDIKSPLSVAENTSDKTLFLSRASQMDREIAKTVFRYFHQTFILAYLNFNPGKTESLFKQYKEQLIKGLQIADSDIVNVKIKKTKQAAKTVNINFAKNEAQLEDVIQDNLEIRTYHRTDPKIGFDLIQEESQGTKKLFFILLSILDVTANNKVLLVDEIGESLHSDIIDYIFNLFRAGNKAQLICTTHNTRFLDLKKFRKDQIFFVNKSEDGATDLYSLYDFSDFRDTMDLEKAYLQGRFDAVPYVNSSLETLKELIDGTK